MKIFKCFGILFLLFLHYELFAQSEKSTQLELSMIIKTKWV